MSEKTGIERAVEFAGSQTLLVVLMMQAGDPTIDQSRIHRYLKDGWVPLRRARIISEITHVPLADLLRRTPKTYKGKPINERRAELKRQRRAQQRGQ